MTQNFVVGFSAVYTDVAFVHVIELAELIQKILQQDLVNPDHFMLANHVVTVRTGRPHGDMNARERRQTGRGPMDTHIW